MNRYVAFLRGVSPVNVRMMDLKRAFEHAGFQEVKTVLSSGNVAFNACLTSHGELARRAEAAMTKLLDRMYFTIVRPASALLDLVNTDPFAAFHLPPHTKKIVTFLREPYEGRLSLPLETDGVSIVGMKGGEIFTAYVPNPRGPVLMTLIEKTFGKDVTTRSWDTVRKCAVA
jgi:uncharacterized protein (DUF1697 family)